MSYSEWLDEVRRLVAVLRPGFSPQLLNPNQCFAAWKSGTSPNDFVQNGAAQNPIAGSLSTPHAPLRPSDPGRKYPVVGAMWGLTAVVLVCGAIGSILYARGMLEGERMMLFVALALDLPACILAFVCLARNETLIHGLAKLGWEVVAGVSVYFLVTGGTANGFSGGANAGYSDGYRDGFNAGAQEQLSHDRAAVGGYGY